MIKKYWDQIRAKTVNALENLSFNGTQVLFGTHTSGRSLQIKEVANPTDAQDVVTKNYLETVGSGGIATVNGVGPDGTLDVKLGISDIAGQDNVSDIDIQVPTEAYGSSWDGNYEVPTKHDLKQIIDTKADGSADPVEDKYKITLNAAGTVQGRIDLIEAGDIPSGWTLTADGKNLNIEHNTGKELMNVTIWNYIDATNKQMRLGAAAFTGLYDDGGSNFIIQSLATVNAKIVIYLNVI